MSTKTRGHHHPSHASNAQMKKGCEKPAPARQEVSEEQRSRLIQVAPKDCGNRLVNRTGTRPGSGSGARPRSRSWCPT